jgi:SAM-dependent methyltransferase
VADITEPPPMEEQGAYDLVILVAVLQVLPPDAFQAALRAIALYLKPGGWLLNFDGYHPFPEHELVRVEIQSAGLRPELPSMNYHYPSQELAETWCRDAGFSSVHFEDFSVSVDLPYRGNNPAATHTVQLAEGRRLSMLGVVAQPWAFLQARR